jgi:hypothetical protein
MHPRQLPRCRLNRRQVVCALFAAALAAGAVRPVRAQDGGDMVEFVRKLYVRQVALHAGKAPARGDAFYSLFARDLRALMQAPRPGAAREPIGRILNAFFGWGVLPGQPVQLDRVMPADGGAGSLKAVQVDLVVRGEKRQIIVRPVREDGLWKIADISYDHGDSLLAYYQRITGR